jgi:hypothetical protein
VVADTVRDSNPPLNSTPTSASNSIKIREENGAELPPFTTLGTCHQPVYHLTLSECPGATLYLRVRAVASPNSQFTGKSLWSASCCVSCPEEFHLSTSHTLHYPITTATDTTSGSSTSISGTTTVTGSNGVGGSVTAKSVTASNDSVTAKSVTAVEFGHGGVLAFLGTAGGSEAYVNPSIRYKDSVTVESSCTWFETECTRRVNLCTDRYPTPSQLTEGIPRQCSHLILDLGANRTLQPSAYTLRGFLKKKSFLSSWQLEGSDDKNAQEWTLLKRHANDSKGLHYNKEHQYATGSWLLPVVHRSFRYFRLTQLDPTITTLPCSGIELYGTLTLRNEDQFRGQLMQGVYIPE